MRHTLLSLFTLSFSLPPCTQEFVEDFTRQCTRQERWRQQLHMAGGNAHECTGSELLSFTQG